MDYLGKSHITKLILLLLPATMLLSGCIDELDGVNSKGQRKYVIYGRITTEPPPYEVRITKSAVYNQGLTGYEKVNGAKVRLHSGSGESELLSETADGIYKSDTLGIRGEIGEEYYITVQMPDGSGFYSEPEMIGIAPSINDLRFEFSQKQMYSDEGVLVDADGFRIYAEFEDIPESSYYLLDWRKTYKEITRPELKTGRDPYDNRIIPAPPRCSGWVRDTRVFGLVYRPFDECTCCECYVTEPGDGFELVNDRLIAGNSFKSEIGFVPVNRQFLDKVYVQARLISLSARAYDYWNKIKLQLENTGTLFDSPPGNILGNILPENPEDGEALGYFMAAGGNSSVISIDPLDIPYPFSVSGTPYEDDCRVVIANSTTIKPDFWE